jgi:hypothetical protein
MVPGTRQRGVRPRPRAPDRQGVLLVTTIANLFEVDADELYRAGPSAFGPERWANFLTASNDLLRVKDRPGVVDEFFRVADGRFAGGRDRAELFRSWLREDPIRNSVLDPLVPAIVAAVDHWGQVTVAHDRQTQLPAARVARLKELCGDRLVGLRFLDAGSHPQIQLADILAGTIRKIASDQRDGRADPMLAELARPYIGASSIMPASAAETPSAGG